MNIYIYVCMYIYIMAVAGPILFGGNLSSNLQARICLLMLVGCNWSIGNQSSKLVQRKKSFTKKYSSLEKHGDLKKVGARGVF